MSGIAPSGGRQHIPALDGLRGIAVAGVVLYHLDYMKGGFLGVDLFFVLSGYLITTLLVDEWQRDGQVDLGRFWVRRARRLLPALLLVLVAVAIYASIGAEAIDRDRIRTDGLAALFYVANWHQVFAGTNYFDLFRSHSPLEHMWSLAIEEQFYLLWPLLVLVVLGRRSRHSSASRGLVRLFVVSIGLAIASVAVMQWLYQPGGDVDRVYYGTDTRAGAILMGAALAVGHQRWGRSMSIRAAQVLDCVAILFLGAIAVSWGIATGTSEWLYRGGLTATGLAVCVLMAALVTPTPGLLGTLLSFAPLRWLGRISYGLYLWHWPVIVALSNERTGLSPVGNERHLLAVIQVVVSLVLAVLSAALVEMPIRQGALKGRRGLSFAGVGAAVAAVSLFAATTANTSPLAEEMAIARENPGGLIVATDPVDTTLPVEADPVRTLVVGDSGAYYLGAGMARVAADFDRTIVNRGTVGCGVARGDGRLRIPDGRIFADSESCGQYLNRWQAYVDEFQPERVILLIADVGGGERFVQGRWMGDCNPEFDNFFKFEIGQGVRVLSSRGAKVTVTTIPDIATVDGAAASGFTDCRNKALRDGATAFGAQIVDLRAWACPTPSTCLRNLEGVDLRPDRVHFLGPGADIAARWILPQVVD